MASHLAATRPLAPPTVNRLLAALPSDEAARPLGDHVVAASAGRLPMPMDAPLATERSPEARAVPHDPPRLLVVDADAPTRALLQLLFAAEGYCVDQAASLDEAAAQHATERADLILADGCCTTHAAFETTAPRILAAAAGTPIVLLSALALDPADARAHGFRTALPKPFDIDDLRDQVRAALAP